ncbi:MAG: DUF1688 family protein [Polyangiales bacterium]
MSALHGLLSPRAVRDRATQLLAAGLAGRLTCFEIDEVRLIDAARLTAQVTRERYPSLQVPGHGRLAHFDAGGVPRTAAMAHELSELSALERARRTCELIVASVLLDAGAGSTWCFVEPETGLRIGRSEGLALASLAWIKRGGLSVRGEPYRVDAEALVALSEPQLSAAFQVTLDNPLVGVAGRVQLLNELGRRLAARPDVFGPEARFGGLVDWLLALAAGGRVAAADVLGVILDTLGPIWPGGLWVDGVALGDVWRHAAIGGEGATAGLLPLHKLSQWLCYSLLAPLASAGLTVVDQAALTGLAEYRNGGLFIDTGVLVPKHSDVLGQGHAVSSQVVIEWRGLTVALLDRLAPLVRAELGLDETTLPLAAVLEGGSWAAGRVLAQRLRPDGGPPIKVLSDGTVF